LLRSEVHRLDADTSRPTLFLRGEIDLHAARRLNEPIADLVGSRAPTIVIDLTAVTFMDSTALGALVRTHQRLHRQARKLVLVCPEGPALRLLELSGLLTVLTVVSSAASIPADS
jgi:anti-sigma B factor antagonist